MTSEALAAAAAPNEHEDPSVSSASLCIEFELLGETFGPVFTHQAFPGEMIRGYHPPLRRLMTLNAEARAKVMDPSKQVLLHSSHVHHEAAMKELSIKVKLSPSCEACQVNICTEQKRLPRRLSLRASKRQRLRAKSEVSKRGEEFDENHDENHDEDEDNSNGTNAESEPEYADDDNSSNGDDNDDDSEFEADENVSEVEGKEDKEGATRKSRMPTKEIQQSMKKGLPSVSEKRMVDRFLRRPLGTQLKDYCVKGKDFVLCLATGAEVAKFHNEVQRLALWFIETADDVDVASEDGGFWKVLYILEKHTRTRYSLAGYTTLFHFHAPFKKPKAGCVVRICQALVLPPYQRSGHGKQMLTCVFDIAHGSYDDLLANANRVVEGDEIVEINVESPAPAFVMLRNRTDFDGFLRSMESHDPWFPIDGSVPVTDESFFLSLPESETVQAAAKAKITPRQIQIVQELYKLLKLHEYLDSSGNNQKEELEKLFRLMVKKRLNKENREHLSGIRTKGEKQAFLEEEFSKCLESYLTTLGRRKTGEQLVLSERGV